MGAAVLAKAPIQILLDAVMASQQSRLGDIYGASLRHVSTASNEVAVN